MISIREMREKLRRLHRYTPSIASDADVCDTWLTMERDDDGGWLSRREVFEALVEPTDVERGAGLRRREGA